MDRFIAQIASVQDGDLTLCEGVAYQTDMQAGRVPYGADYLAKIDAYEGSPIAQAVNAGRCALLARHLREGAAVLDVGAGSGAFVRCARSWGFEAHGFDVIPEAVERLRAAGLYAEGVGSFDAVTLWDVLEHIEEPEQCLGAVRIGATLFVSLPVFEDLSKVRDSKHYRPGEHLYYFEPSAFVDWMELHGFKLLEASAHEMAAGRDSIGAFAFQRTATSRTAQCPCGGETFVDSFDWPNKPRTWYLRCEKCQAISDESTDQREVAARLIIPARAEVA